jgi:hypothetical protein
VLHVPSEYPTIGAAFESVSDSDTVLVALGEYYEGLIAPPAAFWLIGDVPPDTGEYPRPLIDVTLSPDSLDRACLTATAGSDVSVERFRFRTRVLSDSLPNVGGIYVSASHIRVTDCLFDSTRSPIQQQRWIVGVIELERCIFHNNFGPYAHSPVGAIIAHECRFRGGGAFAHLWSSSGTQVIDCVFEDNPDHSFITATGSHIEIRSCTFGPGPACGFHAIELGHFSGVFADNVIKDLVFCPSVVYVEVDCSQDCQITGNTFVNLNRTQWGAFSPPLQTFCWHPDSMRIPYVVSNNVFAACSTTTAAKAIYFQGNARLTGNRFFSNRPSQPAVLVGNQADSSEIRGNLFQDNGWGADTWIAWTGWLDARWNWWGDSSGPYHPALNPEGLGDTVGDNVIFIPWLTDSILAAAPDPLPRLPDKFSLEGYPNPFNPEIRLKFTVAEPGRYRMELYNLMGRKVRDLFEGAVVIDREVTLNAADLPSGVYFARARRSIDSHPVATAKLILLK